MRPSSVLPSRHQFQMFQGVSRVGYMCPSVVAGLLLLQVPRESRLSPGQLVVMLSYRGAAMVPSVTLLGGRGPGWLAARSNSMFLLQFFCQVSRSPVWLVARLRGL